MKKRLLVLAAVTIAALGIKAPLQANEKKISYVTAWSERLIFGQDCIKLAQAVNRAGKGVVEFTHRGGPSVMPTKNMPDGLRRGVIQALCAPSTYFIGIMPEGDALVATTKTPEQLRKDGDFKVLQEIWRKKLNAHLIAWTQSSIGYHIYLRNEPKIAANGLPDFSGLKIRTSPTYREMLRQLGATTVSISVRGLHTALERGVVDGTPWPAVALTVLGVDKFLRYRIEPAFLHLPSTFMVNLDVWNGLSPKAQRTIEMAAAEYEKTSREIMRKEAEKERALLQARGMKIVELKGEAAKKYVDLAHQVVWDRMIKAEPETGKALKRRLYK